MFNASLLLYGLLALCVLDISSTPILSEHPPDRLVPPPLQPSSAPYSTPAVEPTFMQKVARWFGYGSTNDEQHVQSSEIQERYSENIMTEEPQQSSSNTQRAKQICNLCNKVPWIPMLSQNRQIPVLKENFLGNPSQIPPNQLQYPISPPQQSQAQQQRFTQQASQIYQSEQKRPHESHRATQQNIQQKPIQQTFVPQAQHPYPQLTQQLQLPHILQHTKYTQIPQQQSFNRPYQSQYLQQPTSAPQQQSLQPAQGFHYQPNMFYKHNSPLNQQHILLPTYASYYMRPTLAPGYSNVGITSPEYQHHQSLLPAQQAKHRLVPIPIPNLSVTPIPPLYNAKPFLAEPYLHSYHPSYNRFQDGNQLSQNSYNSASSLDLVPPYVSSKSQESASLSSSNNDNIEIIKSISLGDFTTSIEYPPSIVQSPVIDLTQEVNNNYAAKSYINPDYLTEPIVLNNNENIPPDSFSSASSHNFTAQKTNDLIEIVTPIYAETTVHLDWTTDQPQLPISESSSKRYNAFPTQSSTTTIVTDNYNNFKRNRDTPKDLLDSPIYYLKKLTSPKPTTIYPSEMKLTNSPQNDYSLWSTSSQFSNPSTVQPELSQTTFHHPIDPAISSEKKPKQIQIIIPYTTKNHPSPFRRNKVQTFDKSSGWSNHNDYHESQESKIVTATVTQPPPKRTTKYLTKILASNLRELLKKEKNSNYTPVDISKLQKNIDVWTEQEFSLDSNKASTISLLSQSKNIPTEYLTTTPSDVQQYTATEAPTSAKIDDQFYADEEYRKYEVPSNKFIDENLVQDPVRLTTQRPASFTKVNSTPRPNELWNKLNLDFSPITKEKVYVVTPQPFQEESQTLSDFKSPRFLVRPTPGMASTSSADVTQLTEPS